MHRRTFCKALAATSALATPMLLRSAFADEVSSIVLISQTGLPYLPMMVMEHFKLIEKHAEKLGVASLKPEFKSMGGTQSLIDALLSGQMNLASPACQAWPCYGIRPPARQMKCARCPPCSRCRSCW